jgi:ABC-2 type transport system permease protein
MLRVLRSELARLNRPGVLLGWVGLSAALAGVLTLFVFTAVADGIDVPATAPGGAFPSAAQLAAGDGIVAALGSAVTLLGVVTLAFWARSVAGDHSTGLLRLLVQAEPNRLRLLAGKVLALSGWTALAAAAATGASVGLSLLLADGAGISTAAWSAGVVGTVATGFANALLALLVWGVIGLAIAVVSRSAVIAIAGGTGYVLVFENVVALGAEGLADRLPGAVLSAVAAGGTDAIAHGTALALASGYAIIGLVAAAVVTLRRDVTG